MYSSIEKEIFLRKKIPIIYILISILIVIILISSIFILNMKYQSIIKTPFIIKEENNNFYITINIEEENIKYITNNNKIKLDNKVFYYKVSKIDNNLYINTSLSNYKVVYLSSNLSKNYKINNYTSIAKINKEKKKIIEYIIDYFIDRS